MTDLTKVNYALSDPLVKYSPRDDTRELQTFHNCFAMDLMRAGYLADTIRTILEFLAHKDAITTMIYAHVLDHGGLTLESPINL